MVDNVVVENASEALLLFAELGNHQLGEPLLYQLGGTALFILTNLHFRPAAQEGDTPIDDRDESLQRIRMAIGAAVCLHPDPASIPLSLRSEIALRIGPEFERRGPKRDENYDSLVGMKNRNAFIAARPAANDDPDQHFGLLDCKGIRSLNDILTPEAGDALIRLASECIKIVAVQLDMESDIYIFGNDDFAAIGTKIKIEQFIDRVTALFSEHISSGKPLVDWDDNEYPIELYKDLGLGLHVGIGPTFRDAWEPVKKSKDRSRE